MLKNLIFALKFYNILSVSILKKTSDKIEFQFKVLLSPSMLNFIGLRDHEYFRTLAGGQVQSLI